MGTPQPTVVQITGDLTTIELVKINNLASLDFPDEVPQMTMEEYDRDLSELVKIVANNLDKV